MSGDPFDYAKIRNWKKRLESEGCRIHGVEILQKITRTDGSLLFALVRADAEDPEGRKLLPLAMVRGHACVVVVQARNSETGEQKFVMVRQRRIANGQASLEFPAGMLDDSDDPQVTAQRELEEETGLAVALESLKMLHPDPLYSSPGLNDEGIYYFACEVVLSAHEFVALKGRAGGLADEGEHIEVGLWDYEEAIAEVSSLQVMLGFHLWFKYIGSN